YYQAQTRHAVFIVYQIFFAADILKDFFRHVFEFTMAQFQVFFLFFPLFTELLIIFPADDFNVSLHDECIECEIVKNTECESDWDDYPSAIGDSKILCVVNNASAPREAMPDIKQIECGTGESCIDRMDEIQ